MKGTAAHRTFLLRVLPMMPSHPHRVLRLAGLLLALNAAFLLGGCANYLAPFEVQRARSMPLTPATTELRELPPPKEPVVVAVYRFRDQTGQYKALETVSTFSTQVTQGATSILMGALEESGWFVPIEREGLSNLLNERQIIQSIRAQHAGPDGEPLGPLPPLLYAGILLEGGIIGYDTNVLTGGVGARYLGTGGSGDFRQDQVTVYLRAVSTQSGRVLHTVNTTKTIVSQRVQGGLFRFVDANRLLETEAGYSYNEPPVLAVTEAIEEAVRRLIIEGAREGLWAFADTVEPATTAALYREYDLDLARARERDTFGRVLGYDRGRVGFGVQAGAGRLESDYTESLVRPLGGLTSRFSLSRRFAVGLDAQISWIAVERGFDRLYGAADLRGYYYLMPTASVSPYLTAGGGALTVPDQKDDLFGYVTAGAGFEFFFLPDAALGFSLENLYPFREGLDGLKAGDLNDNVWLVRLSLLYYGF